MSNRYRFAEEKSNDDGNRVYKSTIYPDLNTQDSDDIVIETEKGRRLDRLADEYYDDSTQWWVIAEANKLGKGSMYVEAGTKLKIPTNLSKVYNKLQQKNTKR